VVSLHTVLGNDIASTQCQIILLRYFVEDVVKHNLCQMYDTTHPECRPISKTSALVSTLCLVVRSVSEGLEIMKNTVSGKVQAAER